ncbi:DNA repair protein rhp54 [Plakobranchus ocellatus]|uniref:DNA repair protein rhp54 n=1 Tax=Plakobranchus ocellatus TaxID=259542 RepID=A0AAV4AKM8_9GAST|nr:DNA repair protein rhp54 [Plakobranchus ocellatus]
MCYNRMVKSDSYGSIKILLSEIVDNVMNRISIAAEDPSLSSTAASSCHGGDGASTDVSLIGSPIQSNRGLKRRRENAWKCNIAKARRNVGKDYVSKKRKHARERKVKAGCGIECRRKCHSVINEGERQLFHRFWQLGCVDKQREYLNGVVVERKRKVTKVRETSRRKRTYQWHFKTPKGTFEVCKKLFWIR